MIMRPFTPTGLSEIERVFNAQNERTPFSGVLSARKDGQVIFERAAGLANRSAQAANRPDTRFGTASGSKTFTSVAVGQLVDKGLLSFDMRLKDCLAIDLPTAHPDVTLHHLLSHTSGIGDYFDEEVQDDYEALWRDRPVYAFRRCADFLPLFRELPMKFKPGERWSYNNAAFIVLGLVVEQAAGMEFYRYVEENIFAACGMTASGYFALDALPENTASGYIEGPAGVFRSNIYSIPITGGGDGGAFTTVQDLNRFWDALLGGRLLQPATLERMLHPHYRTDMDQEVWYGYGLWIPCKEGKVDAWVMLGEDPGVAFKSLRKAKGNFELTMLANLVPNGWEMLTAIEPLLKKQAD
jgi:CubicO group peptidase (beta-lactamase class C family)